jgi:glyoxylase-like metal-dependent hydrolase (beta-lactamase superfamily II)
VNGLVRGPDGIAVVDAEYVRPRMAAVHVIVHDGRAAIVDSGSNHSVPRVLEALEELGVAREAVDWLLLTHVHLDHAGGAGALAAALPRARAVVHPRGAPHLVDPSKLVAGTIAVYGEALYQRLYGELVPIPAARVVTANEGDRIALAGRVFEVWHTPGHALHHQVYVDAAARTIFTGDTFGLCYPEFTTDGVPFAIPTTTPTQFDPDQLLASIARIAAWEPRSVHMTHYGRIEGTGRIAEDLALQVRALVDLALSHRAAPDREERLRSAIGQLFAERARAAGCPLRREAVDALLEADVRLNAAGLVAWLERTAPRH